MMVEREVRRRVRGTKMVEKRILGVGECRCWYVKSGG